MCHRCNPKSLFPSSGFPDAGPCDADWMPVSFQINVYSPPSNVKANICCRATRTARTKQILFTQAARPQGLTCHFSPKTRLCYIPAAVSHRSYIYEGNGSCCPTHSYLSGWVDMDRLFESLINGKNLNRPQVFFAHGMFIHTVVFRVVVIIACLWFFTQARLSLRFHLRVIRGSVLFSFT